MPADSIKCLPGFTSRMMCNFLWELKYNFITLYGNSRILKRNRLIWPAGPVDDREQRQLKIYCRKNKQSNTCPIKLRWSDCRWDETAATYKRRPTYYGTFTFYALAWVPQQIIIHLWTWIPETLYLYEGKGPSDCTMWGTSYPLCLQTIQQPFYSGTPVFILQMRNKIRNLTWDYIKTAEAGCETIYLALNLDFPNKGHTLLLHFHVFHYCFTTG